MACFSMLNSYRVPIPAIKIQSESQRGVSLAQGSCPMPAPWLRPPWPFGKASSAEEVAAVLPARLAMA